MDKELGRGRRDQQFDPNTLGPYVDVSGEGRFRFTEALVLFCSALPCIVLL